MFGTFFGISSTPMQPVTCSDPTRINSRYSTQSELNNFFQNTIRVEFELIWIDKNSIRINSNGIRIDSNEIAKNSKNSFFQLGNQYYTKTSIILTVLIICSRISLKSTGFSDNSIIIEYFSIWKNPNNTHPLRLSKRRGGTSSGRNWN